MIPKNRSEEWIAQIVPGKTFVDIGGIGEEASNERVTFAHAAGARSCMMADLHPTTHFEWDVFRRKCASLGMPAFEEFGGIDITSPESLKRIGKVDVVYSTGILYHLPSPPDALWSLRSIVGEYLITNTINFPNEVTNEFGTIRLPDCGVLFLPAMTDVERKVIGRHYRDRFGWRPGWKDIDHMAPEPGNPEKPNYVQDGRLSFQPNWFYYSDHAFRTLLHLCGFTIVDEWKWEDSNLHVLCRTA
jgi:hypothetical protein